MPFRQRRRLEESLSPTGAVAGMADQPLQAVLSNDGSSSLARLLAAGFGRGLVGAVAKPLGGAAGLVAHTGAGLIAGAGLGAARRPRRGAGPEEALVRAVPTHPVFDRTSGLVRALLSSEEPLWWLCAALRLDEDSGQAGPVILALSGAHLLAWSPTFQVEPALFALPDCRIERSPAGPDCLLVVTSQEAGDTSAVKVRWLISEDRLIA